MAAQEFVLNKKHPGRPHVLRNLIKFVTDLPDARSWIVEIKAFVNRRTTEQNNALWGVAYKTIEAETGHSKQELHNHFLGEFFGEEDYWLFGKHYKRPMRTTTTGYRGEEDILSTVEFRAFYDFIVHCALENANVTVPPLDPMFGTRFGKPRRRK